MTTTTNSDLAEIKALAKSLAKANTLHQQQLTAALARLSMMDTAMRPMGEEAVRPQGAAEVEEPGAASHKKRTCA